MLSLESPRWSALNHAYGPASDIPALLARLHELPKSQGDAEPWFTLWSALAHQGDVYSASFAAVPHVVAALASAPTQADSAYFQFPAWVEICRERSAVQVPADLSAAYFQALARLPGLVAQASAATWQPDLAACALSAVAAAKGHHALAEAVLELCSPELAAEFIEWRADQ
ncbi:MAG: hypothetical protein HC937_00280 [Aquincola sp.]|nr:hypothetical protein [Aquincola sp.]